MDVAFISARNLYEKHGDRALTSVNVSTKHRKSAKLVNATLNIQVLEALKRVRVTVCICYGCTRIYEAGDLDHSLV